MTKFWFINLRIWKSKMETERNRSGESQQATAHNKNGEICANTKF
jgi:hypothetical protein